MRESTAQTIQVVAGVIAVTGITVAAIVSMPEDSAEMWAMIGSAFVVIAGLLGVHYGIVTARNGSYK